jgi:hypothetical protein
MFAVAGQALARQAGGAAPALICSARLAAIGYRGACSLEVFSDD